MYKFKKAPPYGRGLITKHYAWYYDLDFMDVGKQS